jgi:hypothetical protein
MRMVVLPLNTGNKKKRKNNYKMKLNNKSNEIGIFYNNINFLLHITKSAINKTLEIINHKIIK